MNISGENNNFIHNGILKNIIRKIISIVSIIYASSIPSIACAQATQTTNVSGTIVQAVLSGASNYAFRITITQNGTSPLAACKDGFAYINVSDDNYQAKVSAMLSAFMAGKPVGFTMIPDSNGFCQMTDFWLGG